MLSEVVAAGGERESERGVEINHECDGDLRQSAAAVAVVVVAVSSSRSYELKVEHERRLN